MRDGMPYKSNMSCAKAWVSRAASYMGLPGQRSARAVQGVLSRSPFVTGVLLLHDNKTSLSGAEGVREDLVCFSSTALSMVVVFLRSATYTFSSMFVCIRLTSLGC
jgi:hypothetical protein